MLKNEEVDSLTEPLLSMHNSDPDLTSICWAESIIITKNKHYKNETISKAYSILLDTPANIHGTPEETMNAPSCYEVAEKTTDQKKTLNFNTTKETEDYIIKEHKTLYCGAGPVLSHHLIVWPKLKRKQIEISINPLGFSKLKNCDEIMDKERLKDRYEDNGDNKGEADGKELSVADQNDVVGYPLKDDGGSEFNKKITDAEEDPIFEEQGESPNKTIGAMYGSDDIETRNISMVETMFEEDNENIRSSMRRASDKAGNSLLTRQFNCTMDGLGVCEDMMEKSKEFVGYSNSSKIVMGDWFFPDVALDGPLDTERSFMLTVKVIVNLKRYKHHDDDHQEEDDKETELMVEEKCLMQRSTTNSIGKNKETYTAINITNDEQTFVYFNYSTDDEISSKSSKVQSSIQLPAEPLLNAPISTQEKTKEKSVEGDMSTTILNEISTVTEETNKEQNLFKSDSMSSTISATESSDFKYLEKRRRRTQDYSLLLETKNEKNSSLSKEIQLPLLPDDETFLYPRNCSNISLSLGVLAIISNNPTECFYVTFNDICTSNVAECFKQLQSQCTKENAFVHPKNCRIYFICNWDSKIANFRITPQLCQQGYVYDIPTNKCIESSCKRKYA